MFQLLMSMSELAESVGETVGTITYYEGLGLIRASVAGSSPRYDEIAQLRLQVISKGKRLGFSLQEIGALLDARQVGHRPNEIVPPPKFGDWDDAGCD